MLQIGEAILDPGLKWINFFNGRLRSGEDLTPEHYLNIIVSSSPSHPSGVPYGMICCGRDAAREYLAIG